MRGHGMSFADVELRLLGEQEPCLLSVPGTEVVGILGHLRSRGGHSKWGGGIPIH